MLETFQAGERFAVQRTELPQLKENRAELLRSIFSRVYQLLDRYGRRRTWDFKSDRPVNDAWARFRLGGHLVGVGNPPSWLERLALESRHSEATISRIGTISDPKTTVIEIATNTWDHEFYLFRLTLEKGKSPKIEKGKIKLQGDKLDSLYEIVLEASMGMPRIGEKCRLPYIYVEEKPKMATNRDLKGFIGFLNILNQPQPGVFA